jgi:hypothetical protein
MIEHPAASCGVSVLDDEICLNGVTLECFYRGSTMLTTTLSHVEWVGGPVPNPPAFALKACGNDGLRIGN